MLARLLRNENGQSMVEYGLLTALITVGAIGAVIVLSPGIVNFFTAIDNQLAAVPGA